MDATLKAIQKYNSFVVCSHVGPDGDAMASMLALGLGLEQMGKEVVYFNHDGVPETLAFLPNTDKVISNFRNGLTCDAAISLDCGSFQRLGKKFADWKGYKALINVDHHASNDKYGDINYIIPDAASTGEVVWSILKTLGCKLTPEIATNIYCTLVTDTGSFQYSNTSAGTLRLAAEMVDAGTKPHVVSQNLFESKPFVMFQLLQRLLERLSVSPDGRYSWSVMYQKDLEEAGTGYEVTEEFINYPRSIKGVEIACLYKELPGKKFKVSMRSKNRVDVSLICQAFGGGGHKRAAACVIPGTFEEVQSEIVSKIKKALG